MSTKDISITNKINTSQSSHDAIHKLISCENLKDLASSHSELCHGIFAVLNGGSDFSEIQPLFLRLIEQSGDIEHLIALKISCESGSN